MDVSLSHSFGCDAYHVTRSPGMIHNSGLLTVCIPVRPLHLTRGSCSRPNTMPIAEDKSLFLDAEFDIQVPRCPDALELPPINAASSEVDEWLGDLRQRADRSCCFYGMYVCTGASSWRSIAALR